ncbi:MAG: LysM peptidoglycan-binding domain-containing protein [Acidobacterium ailaaui]|nr:LysM peptidoglycan-binding domain-containing protein [Pseudacidobacterium ailaaui]
MSSLIFLLGVCAGHAQDQLLTTDAYIQLYKNLAIEEMIRTGVPASISLAQAIVESQSGNGWLARNANNHFGIKCKNWTGATVTYSDDRPNECFRKYVTVADSWRDHSDFLRQNPRYAFLFQYPPTDYQDWAYGLKQAGYATNPAYAQMLIKVIEDYHLQQYTLEAIALQKGQDTTGMAAALATSFSAVPASVYPSGVFTINHRKVVYVPAGTSLLTLAHQYGIKLRKLLLDNDLSSDAPPAQPMLIFLQSKKKTGAHLSHVVQAGETMHSIAQQEGIRLKWLYKRNHMQPGDEPAVGETLVLRGETTHPPRLAHHSPNNRPGLMAILSGASVEDTSASSSQDSTNLDPEIASQPSSTPASPDLMPNPWKQPSQRHAPNPSAAPIRKIYHTVTAGDTLYSLARKYQVTVQQLKDWNHLSGQTIRVGQQLIIYSSSL